MDRLYHEPCRGRLDHGPYRHCHDDFHLTVFLRPPTALAGAEAAMPRAPPRRERRLSLLSPINVVNGTS